MHIIACLWLEVEKKKNRSNLNKKTLVIKKEEKKIPKAQATILCSKEEEKTPQGLMVAVSCCGGCHHSLESKINKH